MSINNVTLVGRMVADADLRYTPNGKSVANFRLAVNRPFKNQSGENEADFINCVIWNKGAESLAQFMKKGSLVGVEGSIQTRNYENDNGQRVYVTEVLVNRASFLESKGGNGGQPGQGNPYQNKGQSQGQGQPNPYDNQNQQGRQAQGQEQKQGNQFQNQGQPQGQTNPWQDQGQQGPLDISDQDLPF